MKRVLTLLARNEAGIIEDAGHIKSTYLPTPKGITIAQVIV